MEHAFELTIDGVGSRSRYWRGLGGIFVNRKHDTLSAPLLPPSPAREALAVLTDYAIDHTR